MARKFICQDPEFKKKHVLGTNQWCDTCKTANEPYIQRILATEDPRAEFDRCIKEMSEILDRMNASLDEINRI